MESRGLGGLALPRFFGAPPPAHALSQPRVHLSSANVTLQFAEPEPHAQFSEARFAEAPQEQHEHFSESPRVHFSEVPSRQGRRLATAAKPPRHAPRRRGVCHHASLPAAKYALTPAMVRRHTAPPNTLIVTFANPQHGAFALTWARLLDGSAAVARRHGGAARRRARAARGRRLRLDGPLMQANGQAGGGRRWRRSSYGVDVLLSAPTSRGSATRCRTLPPRAVPTRPPTSHADRPSVQLRHRAAGGGGAAAARGGGGGPGEQAAAAQARVARGDLDLEDAYDCRSRTTSA